MLIDGYFYYYTPATHTEQTLNLYLEALVENKYSKGTN